MPEISAELLGDRSDRSDVIASITLDSASPMSSTSSDSVDDGPYNPDDEPPRDGPPYTLEPPLPSPSPPTLGSVAGGTSGSILGGMMSTDAQMSSDI